MSARPYVSVVIPAYNEEHCIGDCLRSLMHQKTRHRFEVIVVDNNSTDATRQVVQGFHGRLNVRLVTERTRGRGAARRAGCAAAKGDIILSTDADTILPPDWIESLVSELEKKDVVAVTGVSVIDDCDPATNILYNVSLPVLMHAYRLLCGHYWLNGCNFAVRRGTYEQAGGFDANEDALEDHGFCLRVREFGRIGMAASNRVTVSGRRFRNGLLRGAATYPALMFRKFGLKQSNVPLSNVR